MPTSREPVTFLSRGLKIFGVIHRPHDTTARHPGILIVHGFLGSKDQPHRIFVSLADELAWVGIVALRIDLPGRGDSEGETVDITADGDMDAARTALDALAARPDVDATRLGIVGMSWGGALAASLAGRDRRLSSMALWSCVPDELDWRPTFEMIEGREVQELWGNIVGRQFYESLHQISPIDDIRTARGPVLLAYGTADEVIPPTAIERAQRVLDEAGIPHDAVAIDGADHAFMRYIHKRELIRQTVAWLRRTVPSTVAKKI